MPNLTPNYSFNLPLVGDPTDEDLWGGYLNANWSSIDTILNTRTQNYNFADFNLSRPRLLDYAEVVQSLASAAGTLSIDLSLGNHVTTTLTENITTITITNPSATTYLMPMLLFIAQDGTGSRTVAWPSSFIWAGGADPTVTTTASAKDVYSAFTIDAGTTWYANVVGQAFS